MFRHPKYYKELRKLRNKSDQAISLTLADGCNGSVRPGPGLQAASPKHKGSSFKPQASSAKIPDPGKSFTAPEPRCSTKINEFLG